MKSFVPRATPYAGDTYLFKDRGNSDAHTLTTLAMAVDQTLFGFNQKGDMCKDTPMPIVRPSDLALFWDLKFAVFDGYLIFAISGQDSASGNLLCE